MITLMPKSHMINSNSDFQNLAAILRSTSYYDYPYSLITYSPKEETITLTGFSESKVKEVMAKLQHLMEFFSKRWGGKYLVTSQPSTSRALMLDTSSAQRSTDSGTLRVFPIIPKEQPRLVHIWFKSILPALPKILSPRLGGDYAASLVRRGHFDIEAEPCIQIESPCLPGLKAQRIIKDSVSEICKKDGHNPISMQFVEGSVQKLKGGENGDDEDNDDVESERRHRLEFNYNRPYSKPGMGASIGLLCSKKVNATLGGYILIGGEKYILTSKHFVEGARKSTNRDINELDYETLTSPSRYDLNKIENNLKQTKRDLDSELNSQAGNVYDNGSLSADPNDLESGLLDLMDKNDKVRSLLDQVTKLPLDYAVGTVKKMSRESRVEKISRSMANDLGLPNDQLQVSHHMDWALFRTNSQTAQSGENRHKYRSNEDAKDDDYVDESNHVNQPGEICHETCGAESGDTVHYVGQRSKHRAGKVHLPTLVHKDGSETLNWGFCDEEGRGIDLSDVTGDSGAWVIRKEGNKLMGQVHSYSQSRVLFTPIDVVFADLEAACESEVSLPPYSSDPRQVSSAMDAEPLCAVQQTPPARAYRYMLPHVALTSTPRKALLETRPLSLYTKMTSLSNTKSAHDLRSSSPLCESTSSLPGLTDSPQSSATTPDYPKSPQSFGGADNVDAPVVTEKLSSKSLPTIIVDPAMSEIPEFSLDEQGEDQPVDVGFDALKTPEQSLFRMTMSLRTPTWPFALTSKGTKAQGTCHRLSKPVEGLSRLTMHQRGCY